MNQFPSLLKLWELGKGFNSGGKKVKAAIFIKN
jgi:hypothetical protein